MVTIPSLPNRPVPLTGAEVIPLDTGTETDKVLASDLANLSALYASIDLGPSPERLDAAGNHFTVAGAGDPKTVWFPPGSIPAVAGFGYVAGFAGGSVMYQRRVIAAPAGRVYEVEAEIEQVSIGGGESPVARLVIHSLKSDYTDTSASPDVLGVASPVLTAGQIITLTYRFASVAPYGGAAWADPSTARLLRVGAQVNLRSDLTGSCPSSVARVRRLTVRDVTPVVNQAASGSIGGTTERFKVASIVANVLAMDFSQANSWVVALNADITTFTVTGKPPLGEERGVKVVFIADGTARSLAGINAVVKWLGLTNPTFTNTNTYENWCVFYMRDNVQRVVGSFTGPAAP